MATAMLIFINCMETPKNIDCKDPMRTMQIDCPEEKIFTIVNGNGMRAKFCNYGARLMSLMVPDKNGKLIDVVMGFDEPEDYQKSTEPYYGATIGRYANRINQGKFSIDCNEYRITLNNGSHALHGGENGFQERVWEMHQITDSVIIARLHSPHMDEGFPGNLDVSVKFTLTKMNHLAINYEATTDSPTVVNLTNHAFFNLNGSGSILKHTLQINADAYTPVNSELIPTGEIAPVTGTPFDFRIEKNIGSHINDNDVQLKNGKGYDHNFVLNKSQVLPVAKVKGDKSEIIMRIYTTEPGLQFYSGNFMQGKNNLKTGPDNYRTAFCLETQHFPNSPNHPTFSTTILRPGETYLSRTIYAFTNH
ncbi:galactose-1-epimerase [Pedobacter paludis]|uniref:Aldose 1-epimerase n=2 Tax=Pedobacter paludis TaxID=2203212 RepID=A0A317F4E0_9SPHI|nr:galactose-1-epimerase [Pedobacter paludis]